MWIPVCLPIGTLLLMIKALNRQCKIFDLTLFWFVFESVISGVNSLFYYFVNNSVCYFYKVGLDAVK